MSVVMFILLFIVVIGVSAAGILFRLFRKIAIITLLVVLIIVIVIGGASWKVVVNRNGDGTRRNPSSPFTITSFTSRKEMIYQEAMEEKYPRLQGVGAMGDTFWWCSNIQARKGVERLNY